MGVIDKLRTKASVNAMNNIDAFRNSKLKDKLIKDAKHRDPKLKIVNDNKFNNSAYVGVSETKGLRGFIYKLGRKQGLSKKDSAAMANDVRRSLGYKVGLGKSAAQFGKHTVVMGLGSDNPAVLAHEIGHSTMGKSKLGRAYKSILVPAMIPGQFTSGNLRYGNKAQRNIYRVGHGLISANAAHSGYKVGKAKALGKKVGWLTKHKGWIAPAAISAPLLFEEGRASMIGLHRLKKLGASKADMKAARKTLGSAYLTYAIDPTIRMANAGLSYYAAKKLAEKHYKNKAKNESKKLNK